MTLTWHPKPMNDLTTQILAFFLHFGYGSVFVGVMLDNAGIPIPGELVLILTGYMVENGAFAFAPAILAAAAGAVSSDSVWFFAGRWGSKRFIKLYCRFSFGSGGCVERTEHNLRRFGAPSLIYARFIPGFRTFAAPMAGMAGVPYRSFLLFDGIGAVLWASLGVSTGIVFAREIPALASRIEDTRALLLLLAAGAVVLFLLLKWWMRQRHGRAELATVEAETLGSGP
ncbi:MAG: hypothetical protein A3G24_26940 [Betaproteobacteria bacterium RIFCSPLOWO2_12_FULL_62_13]|nr:MAG: hypothetical protein A3G24_26940 [Betaproteobacteria bacterium RIFCSPLOWO2_12_FULL_62_13]